MSRFLMGYEYKWEYDFIPFKEAVQLANLGFDRLTRENNYECFAYYYDEEFCYNHNMRLHHKHDLSKTIWAPLYQQAFVFFMEKYNLNQQVGRSNKSGKWYFDPFEGEDCLNNGPYDNFHQARLALLQKMIQFIKI
jgi:hypothetical protein